MPIVRARKAMDTINVGDVLEVLATDKGAPADFRSWCSQTDQKFLGVTQEDGFFRIVVKKVVGETKEKARSYPYELSNDDLAARLASGKGLLVVDVREEGEYQAGHIPGARLIPIEEIENGIADLDPATEIAVVCRSGRRSDYACQILARLGFARVWNVVPGMTQWTGPVTK
jgi:rhodanese-related sulfurtransferase/TusA-related sulfurtransferase